MSSSTSAASSTHYVSGASAAAEPLNRSIAGSTQTETQIAAPAKPILLILGRVERALKLPVKKNL
jgi:hypothetical protein